jgi:cob(I)alamin adenosyltransferase
MTPHERMQRIDTLLSHVWMVRAFVKHSDEATEDDELASVHRDLYDYMLALGAPLKAGDAGEYLKLAKKKLSKLRKATELFAEIQPEISSHTNFQMAVQSLKAAVQAIGELVEAGAPPRHGEDTEKEEEKEGEH